MSGLVLFDVRSIMLMRRVWNAFTLKFVGEFVINRSRRLSKVKMYMRIKMGVSPGAVLVGPSHPCPRPEDLPKAAPALSVVT